MVALAPLPWLASMGAVAALLSLARFGVNLGFVERPLVVGLAWGVVTGDMGAGVGVGLFFELFWLDLFPAGTFIPPHAAHATLAALAMAGRLGLETPGGLVLPLMLCLPLALLGARLELVQRKWQDHGYDRLMLGCSDVGQGGSPGLLMAWSVAQHLAVQFLFFCVGLAVLTPVAALLAPRLESGLDNLPLAWGHLWLLAALGGLLALRLKRSYLVLAAAVALLAVVNS